MTETTASHPTGGHGAAPRRLVRTSDGKIAGVAAGIAHYLGLDPALVRIAFILLVFAGGVGLLLYVACWIAMPKGEAPPADGASPFDPWLLGAVAALVAGIALLFGGPSWGPGFQVTAGVALVAGGVWLLVRDRDGRDGGDGGPSTTATPPAPPPPAPPPAGSPETSPADAADDAGRGSAPGTAIALREDGGAVGEAVMPTSDEIDDAEVAWAASAPSPTARPSGATPTAAAPAGRSRSRSGALTAGVLSLLAIGSALAIAGALSGWFDVSTSSVAAVALVIVGAGLVLASVVGRAPWLFVVGALLTVVLLAAAAVEPFVDDGIGDEVVRPTSAAELLPTYRFGIGEYTVDLRDVSLAEGTTRTEASLGIGQLVILVPRETTTVVEAEVDAGAIVLPSGREVGEGDVDGFQESARVVVPGTAGGRLLVDAHVRFGELVVRSETEVIAP